VGRGYIDKIIAGLTPSFDGTPDGAVMITIADTFRLPALLVVLQSRQSASDITAAIGVLLTLFPITTHFIEEMQGSFAQNSPEAQEEISLLE
jgi:hypothetical protein